MKKIFFIAGIAAVVSLKSYAQPSFGIQAGGNVAFTQFERGSNDDVSNKPKFGLVAGFLADIPMGPVSFRPEVNFIQKGYKNKSSSTDNTNGITTTFEDENKVRLNYVEVPLNFVYNIPAGNGHAFIGLGPNFALGLSGKAKSETTATIAGLGSSSGKSEADVKFDGNENDANTPADEYHLKRFDFGGTVLAGYTCAMGLTVDLGFTLGLTDISPNSSNRNSSFYFTQKNHGLNLKIGYFFGGSGNSAKKTTGSSTGTGTF